MTPQTKEPSAKSVEKEGEASWPYSNGIRRRVVAVWPDVSDHIALILGAIATVLVAARVLHVAKFDPSVAMAIVQSGGAASLLGILVQVLPLVLGGVAALIAAVFAGSVLELLVSSAGTPISAESISSKLPDPGTAVLGGTAFVVAYFLAPLNLVVFFALVVLGPLAIGWLIRRLRPGRQAPESAATADSDSTDPRVVTAAYFFGGVILMGMVGLVVTGPENRAMWLPAERFALPGGTVVGYAIASDATWTTVLVPPDASLLRVRNGRIRERVLCDITEYTVWERPVHAFFYPDVTPLCSALPNPER